MAKKEQGLETFTPKNKTQWRKWLEKNHEKKDSIWMICYKKKTAVSTISWSDAVDEALCFGWIDSTSRPIDDEKFMRYFAKRKPRSVWSKINKEKVKRLMEAGLITPAGMKSIEIAKQNGSWATLDDVEELKIPKDLEKEFKTRTGSKAFFMSLSRSVRKAMLHRLVLAKRPETRQKRIQEIIEQVGQQKKLKQL